MTEPLDLDYIVGWTWDEEQVDQIVDSLVHELREARENEKNMIGQHLEEIKMLKEQIKSLEDELKMVDEQ